LGKSRTSKHEQAPVQDAEEGKIRFSAKGPAAQRKRLGLSAQEIGLLVGTSGQSIYNWGGRRHASASLAASRVRGTQAVGQEGSCGAVGGFAGHPLTVSGFRMGLGPGSIHADALGFALLPKPCESGRRLTTQGSVGIGLTELGIDQADPE
jgi:hypothetical protein